MALKILVACLISVMHLSTARYTLVDNYVPSNFFSMFTFFTGPDPTHGFVDYVNETVAESTGLIQTNAKNVYIGVDHTNITPNGRPSIRITSNKSYNHGLIILDLQHMPYACGTWPAYWTVGPDWPSNGEIDIIEGVHVNTDNLMTLHTGPNCSITNDDMFTGLIQTNDCYVDAPGQSANAGCGISANNNNTYGSGLNAIGGGVYATEWTSANVSIWFFPRSAIPRDVQYGYPNPRSWGEPLSQFQGACVIDNEIKDQQIVFDDTFCGDWAGNVWQYTSACSSLADTCNDYVTNNPSAFADAYWLINSLKVYQETPNYGYPSRPPWGIASGLPSNIASLAPIPKQTDGWGWESGYSGR